MCLFHKVPRPRPGLSGLAEGSRALGQGLRAGPKGPGPSDRAVASELCGRGTYGTILYHTIRYNTIQYDTIRYDTIRYNTIRYDTIQYATIQYGQKGRAKTFPWGLHGLTWAYMGLHELTWPYMGLHGAYMGLHGAYMGLHGAYMGLTWAKKLN